MALCVLCVCVCLRMCWCVCLYVRPCVCVCVPVCVRTRACMCVCMPNCVCIHAACPLSSLPAEWKRQRNSISGVGRWLQDTHTHTRRWWWWRRKGAFTPHSGLRHRLLIKNLFPFSSPAGAECPSLATVVSIPSIPEPVMAFLLRATVLLSAQISMREDSFTHPHSPFHLHTHSLTQEFISWQ